MIGTIIYGAVGFLLLLMLAKRKRGRSMAGYIHGNIDLNYNLGTLAASDVLTQAVQDTVSERTRCTSIVCTYALSNYTPTADAGPLIQGVAHSDYSDAEIEEWIELSTGWDVGDRVSREISSRLIRRLGTFQSPSSPTEFTELNDGRMIKTRLNWMLETGQNLKFWTYNTGSAALATTTPDVSVAGHANLFTK